MHIPWIIIGIVVFGYWYGKNYKNFQEAVMDYGIHSTDSPGAVIMLFFICVGFIFAWPIVLLIRAGVYLGREENREVVEIIKEPVYTSNGAAKTEVIHLEE